LKKVEGHWVNNPHTTIRDKTMPFPVGKCDRGGERGVGKQKRNSTNVTPIWERSGCVSKKVKKNQLKFGHTRMNNDKQRKVG